MLFGEKGGAWATEKEEDTSQPPPRGRGRFRSLPWDAGSGFLQSCCLPHRKMQRHALAIAACCVGTCSGMRWRSQRAALGNAAACVLRGMQADLSEQCGTRPPGALPSHWDYHSKPIVPSLQKKERNRLQFKQISETNTNMVETRNPSSLMGKTRESDLTFI